MGTVESAGTRLPCCFAYVPQAQVGDYVIMQNGFAIEVLDPASAAESLAIHAEFSTASANEDDSST
jgi:hydrogenase expression/formation protein HypC